jgi:alpha-mannosidase
LNTSPSTDVFLTGRHNIRYAILPHEGPLNEHTIRAGYAFNNPLRLYRHPKAKNNNILHSLLRAFSIRNAPGLIIDTVKRAEDDEDVSVGAFPSRKGKSIIVRVFDSLGGKSTGDLHWGIIPVKKVFVTNLLEDDGEELEVQSFDAMSDGVEITVRAFEVLTLRLQLYE